MTTKLMRAAALGLLIAASPVLAQTPPQATDAPMMKRDGAGPHGSRMGGRMFASLSEAGRATMMEAMKASDFRGERTQVRAARDKMLTVLEADKLDMAALKKAMEEERSISAASHERRQAAMLTGFSKLSAEDRKAFVADARQMREKMQERMRGQMGERMKRWRDRRGSGSES